MTITKAAITHNEIIESIARKTITDVIVTMPLKRFSAVRPIQRNKQARLQCFHYD